MPKDVGVRLAIGIVPAVLLKTLGGEGSFSAEETVVLAAMRRSSGDLANASAAEIGEHVRTMTPEQLAGFRNNVKGIYHELRYVARENGDEDGVDAEMYEVVNHPGADIRLVNSETGETVDIQLKATSSIAHLTEHQERYPNIEVHATEEAALSAHGVASSGFRNAELADDVDATLQKLTNSGSDMFEAGATSGLLSGIVNARAALRGQRTGSAVVRRMLGTWGSARGRLHSSSCCWGEQPRSYPV